MLNTELKPTEAWVLAGLFKLTTLEVKGSSTLLWMSTLSTTWLKATSRWDRLRCFLKPEKVQNEELHPSCPQFKCNVFPGYNPCFNLKCWQSSAEIRCGASQMKHVNIFLQEHFSPQFLLKKILLGVPRLWDFLWHFPHQCWTQWFEWTCRSCRGIDGSWH